MRHDKQYLALLKRISDNMKRVRSQKKLTQEQVAELADFNTRYFQRLEAGHQSPNLLSLYKAALALKVDVSEFFV